MVFCEDVGLGGEAHCCRPTRHGSPGVVPVAKRAKVARTLQVYIHCPNAQKFLPFLVRTRGVPKTLSGGKREFTWRYG